MGSRSKQPMKMLKVAQAKGFNPPYSRKTLPEGYDFNWTRQKQEERAKRRAAYQEKTA